MEHCDVTDDRRPRRPACRAARQPLDRQRHRTPAPASTSPPPAAAGADEAARSATEPRASIEWVDPRSSPRCVIALVIKTFLFQAFYIPSESMVPTLEVGDRVLVNKLSYDLHDVHRGDIVVFEAPPERRWQRRASTTS